MPKLQGSLLCPGSILFLPWLLFFAIPEQILPVLPFYLPHTWHWGAEQLQKVGWRALPTPSVLLPLADAITCILRAAGHLGVCLIEGNTYLK